MPDHPEFLCTDGTILPVGTMYCIGKNYANHAREMGGTVPSEPVVFIKPPSAYLPDGGKVVCPPFSHNLHHEVELVLIIGQDCSFVPKAEAVNVIAGYAIGLDMTLRDVQQKAKERGDPWSVAKAFVTSAPISTILPASRVDNKNGFPHFDIQLHVNDTLRQFGNTAQMERQPDELIAYLSSVFALRRGDCIFTGTPEGVHSVSSGDVLRAELNGDFAETIVLTTTIA